MPAPNEFLNQPDAELEEFLIRLARNEVVPEAARRRALLGVTSVGAGTGLLTKWALAHGSPSSLAKSTTWLVAKWLTLGAGAGALTLTAVQGVEQLALAPAPQESAQVQAAARAKPVRRQTPMAREPEPLVAAAEPPAPLSATDATASAASAVGPASPSAPSAPSAQPVNSLSDELSLLELVRGELAHHQEQQARLTLNDYDARFPHGVLQVEAAALRIEAIGRSGDRELAQRLAESFLANHPTSPLAARVRAFIPARAQQERSR